MLNAANAVWDRKPVYRALLDDGMRTERRGLTEAEAALIRKCRSSNIDWFELLFMTGNGAFWLALICSAANYGLEKIGGVGLTHFTSGSSLAAFMVLWLVISTGLIIFFVFAFTKGQKDCKARRSALLTRDDLLVEFHHLTDCKLVRDPEHGQPMFFVLCEDGCVLFIFEGQDVLDDDWETEPLKLREEDKPRVDVKIIRDPKSKDCEFLLFDGEELALSECNMIALQPQQWPASGKIVNAPWDEIERRYRLIKHTTEGDD